MPTRTTRRPAIAIALAAGLTASLAGTAHAQTIYAETWSGSDWTPLPGFPSAALGQPGLPSGSNIDITLTGHATVRVYADDPAATDVGVITLLAPPGALPKLLVTSGPANDPYAIPESQHPAFRSVGGVIAPASIVALHAQTLTGFGIEAREVVRVQLAGDLDAPIVHWGDPSQNASRSIRSIDVGGSITDRAPIVASDGIINNITVLGDAHSPIASQNGGLGTVTILGDFAPTPTGPSTDLHAWSGDATYFAIGRLDVGGTIGDPNRPAQITTGGPVLRIEADAVHADINTMLDPTDLGFFGGMATRDGDFTGSIYARTLTSFGKNPEATCALEINGDFDAFVYFENGTRNERPDGPEIDIAGSILPDAVLSMATMIFSDPSLPGAEIRVGDPAGLQGQIIAGNERDISFEDPNAIVIGAQNEFSVTPDSKFYTEPFAAVGGGAVGIPPFNFHPNECFPKHNETIELTQDQRLTASTIRLYGPAFLETGATADGAFIVEHLAENASAWTDRAAEFGLEIETDEATGSRRLRLVATGDSAFDAGQWRIRPADARIRCAFVRDTPAIRFDSEYTDDTYRFNVLGGADDPIDPDPDCDPLPTPGNTPNQRIPSDTRAQDELTNIDTREVCP